MSQNQAQFRFYEELNDFLAEEKRKKTFSHQFWNAPAVKDVIESLGVPHAEIDLILVNNEPVDFYYKLHPGDRVAVYPVFESLDISSVSRLREKPLRTSKFILDVHLGKVAKTLRLLGFDSLYRNNYHDAQIVNIALSENRTILTRDKGLLKIKEVTHGYWIRAVKPKEQINEILSRFDLFSQIRPFLRCTMCNGLVKTVEKEQILHRLQPKTKRFYSEFHLCTGCDRIYWQGSHYLNMQRYINSLYEKGNKRVPGINPFKSIETSF